ncbi:hypothetical protein BLA39750_07446 [Burkholderia lata]|uniref:Phage tail protein n=1 Tax=Burkholderia lata (strain ATCC 17760 / DSM 23089 / LMG 22485 / NCIMB 9086 / R18194 / 383) TaxID=482957 RepID=A0A6P3C1U8_BURL3|nr:phage tail assembly chaperone [Burkholderia lata]VWD61389.1 hypothetical protein BLA39750_07446 [Burkholderia lata]
MGQKQAAYDQHGTIVAFYDTVDSPTPPGVSTIDISDDQWHVLIDGQSRGKRAVVDGNMRAALIDPPAPTRDDAAASMRSQRDSAMRATDWLVSRHQDEKLIGNGATLTAAQFAMLIKYRQALREISDADSWPYIALPPAPDFVSGIA